MNDIVSSTESKDTGTEKKKTSLGIDENIEGALSYFLGFITGILFLVFEEDNKFVRFHATQSIIISALLFVIVMILGIIPLFWLILPFVWLLELILWLLLMFKAYQGERFKLPVIGDIAEQQMNKLKM